MSTITSRSVRRAGNSKSPRALSLYYIIGELDKMGQPYKVTGRLRGARVAHTVAHFGNRAKVITGIHPTKKAMRGRIASVTTYAA